MIRSREMVLSSAGFAAVHVMGSNNGLLPWTGNTAPTPGQPDEVKNRTDAERPPKITSEPWSYSCRPTCRSNGIQPAIL
jgi:hypothetical protein